MRHRAPKTPGAAQPRDERRSPDRLYWAQLDASPLPRPLFPTLAAASRRRQLGYLLEPLLPIDLDAVHPVYIESGNKVIACAAPAQELDGLDPEVASLGPSSWPSFIPEPPADACDINLLTNRRTPSCVRRQQANLAWTAALLVLAASLLLSLGLSRRAAHERELVASLNAARQGVFEQVLADRPIGVGADPDTLVRSELNRLARTRTTLTEDPQGSAAYLLASVLESWPTGVLAQTNSISVAPDTITVSVQLAEPDEAQRLTDALGSLDGWRADNPFVSPNRDSIRTTVRIRREGAR